MVKIRYRSSAKGQRAYHNYEDRRLRVRGIVFGHADTPEQATLIKQHIKGRLNEFKQR